MQQPDNVCFNALVKSLFSLCPAFSSLQFSFWFVLFIPLPLHMGFCCTWASVMNEPSTHSPLAQCGFDPGTSRARQCDALSQLSSLSFIQFCPLRCWRIIIRKTIMRQIKLKTSNGGVSGRQGESPTLEMIKECKPAPAWRNPHQTHDGARPGCAPRSHLCLAVPFWIYVKDST